MKKRNIMILMISLSLVLLLGSSYALLRSNQVGSNLYVINVGTLQVTFEDDSTEKLSLTNMYPMSDKEGSSRGEELGFVVENTGSIEARYNVYLEETSTNPEFKNHIRFISNKNNQGYNEPKTMGSDKYIDLEAKLDNEKETSASYKVKIWLDQDADNIYMDKTFTAKVVVEGTQLDNNNTLYTKINDEIEKHPNTTIVEDGVTYLSGSNDDVNYNYVWYSGKLWRITSINSDGTIKIMTEDDISMVKFDTKEVFYSENTEIYRWLNEDFLDSLYNYQNLLVSDAKWYSNQELSTTSPANPAKLSDVNIVTGYVGGLTAYEFSKTYENLSSPMERFSNNTMQYWLITTCDRPLPCTAGPDSDRFTQSNLSFDRGIRPVVVFKDNIEILGGDGTIDNPYTIKGDRETKANDKLNSRVSGEYVKFDNTLYRIIDIEDNKTTKLTMNNILKDSDNNLIKKAFGTSFYYGDNTSTDYWNGYLNQVWYNSITEKYRNMMVVGTYYLGSNGNGLGNRATVCKDWETIETIKTCEKVDKIWVGYVGLLRSFELFSAQLDQTLSKNINNTDNFISTLTPSITTDRKAMQIITPSNRSITYEEGKIEELYPTRPSITLSSKVIVTGGKGTFEDPFDIDMPEKN